MDEKEKKKMNTEDLKNETKETVNKVKETIKKVDIKEDTKATKSFVKEMFSNPFEEIKKVANGKENVFSKAVVLMIIYIAANVLCEIISIFKYGRYSSLGNNFMDLVASFLNPIFFIAVPAIIIYLLNKENKKSLTTIIATLVTCSVPIIINNVIDIVEVLVSGISIITSPISTMFSAIATVLTYFGMKDLFEIEEHNTFIRKYAIIRLAGAFVLLILSRIGIY